MVVTKSALKEAQLGYQQFYFNNEVMANGEVAPVVAALLQDALDTAVPGMYVPYAPEKGPSAHLIVIDDGVNTAINEAELSLTLAHELGHAVYKEEIGKAINNRELRSRYMRDFRRALEKTPICMLGTMRTCNSRSGLPTRLPSGARQNSKLAALFNDSSKLSLTSFARCGSMR